MKKSQSSQLVDLTRRWRFASLDSGATHADCVVYRTVTLKLSARLKARICREARRKGRTPQRWMLEAIERELERRERFLAYVRAAQRAGLEMEEADGTDARRQVRYWLDQISTNNPGNKVSWLRPPRQLRSSR